MEEADGHIPAAVAAAAAAPGPRRPGRAAHLTGCGSSSTWSSSSASPRSSTPSRTTCSLGGFLGRPACSWPSGGPGWCTVYADRFDTDDLLHRVLVLAVAAVIAMALSIHDAYGNAARFALTFVAVRGIVLLLNARARRRAGHAARPLLNLYLTAFSIGASLWLLSVFVPEPACYVLWGSRAADRAVRALGGPPPDRQGADPPTTWSSASGCSPSSCSASR